MSLPPSFPPSLSSPQKVKKGTPGQGAMLSRGSGFVPWCSRQDWKQESLAASNWGSLQSSGCSLAPEPRLFLSDRFWASRDGSVSASPWSQRRESISALCRGEKDQVAGLSSQREQKARVLGVTGAVEARGPHSDGRQGAGLASCRESACGEEFLGWWRPVNAATQSGDSDVL